MKPSPDPGIEDGRDAIIKVTSCAICGSDLHLFHNFMPGMMPGAQAAPPERSETDIGPPPLPAGVALS